MVLLFDHPRSGVVYNFGRVSTHKLVYVAHDSEQSVIVRSVLPHLECGTICLSKSSPHRPLPTTNNRSTSDELLHLLLPVLEAYFILFIYLFISRSHQLSS